MANGDFKTRALKIGATTLIGSLVGQALLRNTNWTPVVRAMAGLGTGVIAGVLVGQKLENLGIGLIGAGAVVGGGFGMQAVAQSGILTPAAASSTATTTGTTTGTTTSSTTTPATTGLGLGQGYRGLGQARRQALVNFQKVPAMVSTRLIAGQRLR